MGGSAVKKEINEEYDINKDGRLNTNERAAVSKDVEAGKFRPWIG